MTKQPVRISELFQTLAAAKSSKTDLTFGEISEAFGKRALAILILFFALPSALPFSAVPGVSFIFSVPIAFFSLQLIFAKKTCWLPKLIANQTISRDKISKIVNAATPYLKKIEHLLKPRWAFLTSAPMEIINGIIIFCLSIFLMLPIPFSNFIFASLIIIFSLGLIEKDGLVIALGYVAILISGGLIFWLAHSIAT